MTGALAFLKPFVWLAAVAFVSGGLSYVALAHPGAAPARVGDIQTTSGPASDDWNLPRHI